MQKILVVEDNNLLNTTITYNLQAEGYAVMQAKSLAQARQHLTQQPDLIVLDISLPDGNGFSFCKEVKEKGDIPVFFLTANDMESDMLKGYELGADDYITKPFSMVVFQKKIAAFLRRIGKQSNPCWNDGHLYIDFSCQKALLEGKALELTAFEFIILRVLSSRPHIIWSRDILLENIWNNDIEPVDEHALTVAISRIRAKIETGGRNYIRTVYGMGYVWQADSIGSGAQNGTDK